MHEAKYNDCIFATVPLRGRKLDISTEFRTYSRVLIKTCSSPKIMQDKMRGLNFFVKILA